MGYVGIDTQGARRVGQALADAAAGAEDARRKSVTALTLVDLSSPAMLQLATISDGIRALGAGVIEKASLAERFTVDPKGVASSLDAPVAELATALTGLVGFGGPADLRSVFTGLPPSGTDAAFDAAVGRLSPALLPALLAGERPELDEAQLSDLRTLALRLGIQDAGSLLGPAALAEATERSFDGGGGFFARFRRKDDGPSTTTEVFWNDFWADGRTVDEVLADPARLLEWVSGTFELDRRLAVATELPELVDVLQSVDFAKGGDSSIETLVAEVEASFPAITVFLPKVLAGLDRTPPTAAQLEQTLAFATRVGWTDPAAPAAPASPETPAAPPAAAVTQAQRFASAVAFLKANRALGSALLPTGFEGSPQPLVFFDQAGIALQLELGRRVGVVTDAALASLDRVAGQIATSAGLDLTATVPPAVDDERLEQVFGALLASQVPPAFLQTPGLQSRFDAALTFIRTATDGPEVRRRMAAAVAAFRTLAVTGAPALTERQLSAIVGPQVIGVLGRSRLRLRSARAFQKNPEFLLVTQTWGVPGGHKEKIGKFKFTWSFDDLGAVSGIRRKKRSTLSRIADTIKSIGKAIVTSFKENPLKAIFQVGKIAVSVLALVFPGTQALGAAALALNVGDAVLKAVEGDWLGALTSGLSAFTAGATDVFGIGVPNAVDALQQQVVDSLLGKDVLGFVKNAKRAVDIGAAVFRAIEADSLVGAIGAGLGAGAAALGSGGQLLGSIGGAGKDLTDGLVRLGTTLADVTRIVAPAAGLIDALERDDTGAAIANGLGVISGGAKALGNPQGAFSPTAPGVDTLFEFTEDTQKSLASIAQGTGIAALVTRAVQAADRGESFATGSLLAQALLLVNDPLKTPIGNRAQIAQRLADVAAVIESIVDRGGDPTRAGAAAAPVILQRLQLLLDAANTPVRDIPPLPVRNPERVRRDAAAAAAVPVTPPPAAPVPPFTSIPTFGLPATEPTEPPSIFEQFRPLPVEGATTVEGARVDGVTTVDGATGELLSATTSDPALLSAPAPLAAPADDVIGGGSGANTLFGGSGDDRLATTAAGLAAFASPTQQVQGTPFSPVDFRMDWFARYITDGTLSYDDIGLDSGIAGLDASTADIPGLVVPTPEPIPPGSRPFDLIRPRVDLPNGDPLVGELMGLARSRPEITIDSEFVVPFGRPGSSGRKLELNVFPRAEEGKVVAGKDEAPNGETTFTMERQGTSFKGGLIPIDADWGTNIGVSRTTVDGTTPESYVPSSGSELEDGESYSLWIRNELRGKVAAGPALDIGYQHGRLVEVQRVGGTLEITVFPEVTQGAVAGGAGVRHLEASAGGNLTTMAGEQYVVPLDHPAVDTIAYNLLYTGGASQTPPHSVVSRVDGTLTGAAELFTLGPDAEVTTQQTETRTRFDDASEQVTGEVLYPGMRVTYAYPVTLDGTAGPVQNVRIEYLDPALRDNLDPQQAQRREQLVSDIRTLPSPVPKEGIQVSISSDDTLDGAAFVGTITVQTPGSPAHQVPAALTFEEYQSWLKDSPGGMQAAVTAYLKQSGLDAHGVGTSGALPFLERAKAAFSTFDLDNPDHPAIPWTAATDPTPPPGTIVTDAISLTGAADALPDPDQPALFQPPGQTWVKGQTPEIDWGSLTDDSLTSTDLPGSSQNSATVPDPAADFEVLPLEPWDGWAGDFQPLPDYASADLFSGYTSDDAYTGYALEDPLSSFTAVPDWDAGTSFDDAWAGAWETPADMSGYDSVSVSEYL